MSYSQGYMSLESIHICNITTFTLTSCVLVGLIRYSRIDFAPVLFLRCSAVLCGFASSHRSPVFRMSMPENYYSASTPQSSF
jgi:hypothetical protein